MKMQKTIKHEKTGATLKIEANFSPSESGGFINLVFTHAGTSKFVQVSDLSTYAEVAEAIQQQEARFFELEDAKAAQIARNIDQLKTLGFSE